MTKNALCIIPHSGAQNACGSSVVLIFWTHIWDHNANSRRKTQSAFSSSLFLDSVFDSQMATPSRRERRFTIFAIPLFSPKGSSPEPLWFQKNPSRSPFGSSPGGSHLAVSVYSYTGTHSSTLFWIMSVLTRRVTAGFAGSASHLNWTSANNFLCSLLRLSATSIGSAS